MRFDVDPEPITQDDAAIRAALEGADVAPLLVAVAQLTGDHDLLVDDLRPDQTRMLEPEAGITPEEMARGRDLAAAALARFRDAGAVPAPIPTGPELRTLMAFLVGDDTDEYLPMLTEELALDGDKRAPAWSKDGGGARRRLPGGDHRGGHVGHRRRPPPRPGRGALHDLREEPRRRRHLVRERLPGLPGRRPQPRLQLLVRPDRRLAAVLLHPGRAAGLLPDLPRPLRPAAPRPLRHRGGRRHVGRGDPGLDPAHHRRGRRRGARRLPGPGQRGGSAQPPELAEHRRHRPVRRRVLPLRRVGPRHRPHRQAGGDHRHRGQRRPVHPDGGRAGRAPRRLPAHRAVAHPHAELPRRPGRGPGLGARARARLRPLGPAVAVLAEPRGPRPDGRGRPRLGRGRAVGEPPQRPDPPAADRLPPARVLRPRPAGQGPARLPAAGQALRAGQRHLGPDLHPGRRGPDHRRHRGDHRDGGAHRRRGGAPGRRDHLRHRLPGVDTS